MIYILLIGGVLFVSGVFCAWVIFKAFGYIYSYFFWGAINVPTTDEKVEQIIKILDLKGKNKAVDLGSGDGRLIIALAKSGVEAHGYEINPFLVSLARKNIQKINLESRAFIYLKNFWLEDLSQFDVIVLFGMSHMMGKMKKKLKKELKPGAIIVSNYFTFPDWQPDRSKNDVYLYIKK